MKTMSSPLLALLATGQFVRADLWTITLNGGSVIRWTSHDQPLTVGGNIFAKGPMIERGSVSEKRGTEVATLEMAITALTAPATGLPTLSLNFTASETLDPRITISGGANGTRTNSSGVIVAALAPRFDYDQATGEPLGLLIEEARTNLLLNSLLNGTSLATQSPTVTAVPHTLSFYGTGTVTLSGASTAGPLVGAGASNRVALTFTPTAGVLTVTVTGSVKWANLEVGASASTFIPTAGATITRTRDLPTMVAPNVAPWFNSTKGTFVVTADHLVSGGALNPVIAFNGLSRSAGVYFDNKGYAGVIFTGDASTANTTTRPGKSKIAFGWSPSSAARVSMNGGAVATGTNTTGAGATSIQLGHTAATYTLNGHLKQIVYYPELKSDFELKALSDPSATIDTGTPNFDTINSTPLIPFIRSRGLDGASIKLERGYAAGWDLPIVGTVIRFAGKVTSINSIQGATARMTVSSWLVLLNSSVPRNKYQAGCLRTLYDAGCALNPASFDAAGTVTVAGQGSFGSGLTGVPGYYSQGRVVFTSGANAGVSRTVKINLTDGTFTLVQPFPSIAAIGDTFTAYAGCDHTKATCFTKFNNLLRFKGQPFVPLPTTALGAATTTTKTGGK